MHDPKAKHIPFDRPRLENTDYKRFCEPSLEAPRMELNDKVVKQYFHATDKNYFEASPQWNDKHSQDRIFRYLDF